MTALPLPGVTAVVYGVGSLGHLALRYFNLLGGKVIAVNTEDTKLDLARQLGADHVVTVRTTDQVQAIQNLGGADVAISLAAAGTFVPVSVRQLSRRGRRG